MMRTLLMRLRLSCVSPLGLAALLMAAGPCSSDPAPAAPAQGGSGTATSPAASVVASQDPYTRATELVDAIAALNAFDVSAVERLVGSPIQRSGAAEEQYFEAVLPSGPFAKIELRLSKPRDSNKLEMIILDVREGIQLSLASFRGAGRIREGMPMTIQARVPPEGTVVFHANSLKQTVRYAFTNSSEQLTSVVIERQP